MIINVNVFVVVLDVLTLVIQDSFIQENLSHGSHCRTIVNEGLLKKNILLLIRTTQTTDIFYTKLHTNKRRSNIKNITYDQRHITQMIIQ